MQARENAAKAMFVELLFWKVRLHVVGALGAAVVPLLAWGLQ